MKRYTLVEHEEGTNVVVLDPYGDYLRSGSRQADVTDHVQLTQDPEMVAIVRAMIQMS